MPLPPTLLPTSKQQEQTLASFTCNEAVVRNKAPAHQALGNFTCFGDGEDAGAVQISQTVAALTQHGPKLVLCEVEFMWAVAESANQALGGERRRLQLLPPLAGVDAPHELHLEEEKRGDDGLPSLWMLHFHR